MEGIALLGLLGVGYFFVDDKNKDNLYEGTPKIAGSENTVYDVNNITSSKYTEQELAAKRHNQAVSGRGNIIDDTLNMNNRRTTGNGNDNDNAGPIGSISGELIDRDKFLRDDRDIKVEPFFSKAPSNVNFDDNVNLINHQGGSHAFRPKKKETGQFFDLQKDYSNVFGSTFTGPNSSQERFIPGNNLQNELPFEQEKISHIDQKSSINTDVAHIRAQRSSVDSTRTISNPKLSYQGKVLGGQNQVDRRGEEGEVYKHLPNQDYWQDADRWLVNTASVTAKSNRPEQILKDTNRQYFNEGKIGPAAPVIFSQHENKPMVKKSTNQLFDNDYKRNVSLENNSGGDDHNKDSYFAYPNERDKTTGRNHISNLVTVFEAETMGIQDKVKPTIKETTNFNYTGGAVHETMGQSATDQYGRADLNINKELISRGRYPTPESTKLNNGADTEHVFINKNESDYFNKYISNPNKLYTTTPAESQIEYTKEKDTLNNIALSDRLDPVLLNPFKTNPYTQSLSSYGYT